MKIAITGATGFLGRPLVAHLCALGHECIALTRDIVRARHAGLPDTVTICDMASLPEADAVIHLAGENPAALWTPWKRRAIFASRVLGTQRLTAAMRALPRPPRVFLCASAVGYYGHRPDETLDEGSAPDPRRRFRARVCLAWEDAANEAADFGARVVALRLGNVMDPSGGFLGKFLPIYRAGGCFVLGTANASIAWIALADAVNLITFAVENDALRGPLNVVAPHSITQRTLATTLARRVGCRVWGRLPAPLLRCVLGELSSALIDDQTVTPRRALDAGFQFMQPAWRSCLDAMFGDPTSARSSLVH
jgi:uncharacterized protein (TIGR01777 family)